MGRATAQVCFWQLDRCLQQRRECVSRARRRRCFQVSSAQLSSASAWLDWLSMEREQGDRDWGAPQWWMTLLRAMTANAIPRGSAARKCSYKCVYALCLLHFRPLWLYFGTTDFHWNEILNYAAVNVVLSKYVIMIKEKSVWSSMIFRYKWAAPREVKAAYCHLL